MDQTKRAFLRAAGLLLAEGVFQKRLAGKWVAGSKAPAQKIVLVIFGGVRHAETFSPQGLVNIPHLAKDLLPQGLFYPQVRNEGVTAHFNATSSIFTGNWQRVDDWGKLPPTTPTFFEYFRKQLGVPQSEVWVVASNKALTSMIGASELSSYGPRFGPNVVFPKQLLITAVETALREGRYRTFADPAKVQAELEATLEGSNYEGLGWTVFDGVQSLDSSVRPAMRAAVANFVQSGVPTTGDELTFFISREIMRKFAPSLLVVIFSDVEAAHFGSYSMHDPGDSARIRARSRWLEHQRLFQSPRQRLQHANHLDDVPGDGSGAAADRREADSPHRPLSYPRFPDGLPDAGRSGHQAAGVSSLNCFEKVLSF